MTSHNQFFGWIHGFRINKNNEMYNNQEVVPSPYRPIIANPSLQQCLQSWNQADTGLLLSFVLGSTLLAARLQRRSTNN